MKKHYLGLALLTTVGIMCLSSCVRFSKVESKDVVDRAKAVLMKQRGLTEPEAHRSMQQYAMNHGMKMAEFAAQILAATKTTEE